ncbi:hypothetical protein GCM10010404_22120 [Nonomuraea africana]
MTPPLRFGYIDESIHDRHGLYLIAVVRAHPSLEGEARDLLTACIPTGQRPHWGKESGSVRDALVRAVASLEVDAPGGRAGSGAGLGGARACPGCRSPGHRPA